MTQGLHLVRRVMCVALLVMALETLIVLLVQLGSIMSTGLLSNVYMLAMPSTRSQAICAIV